MALPIRGDAQQVHGLGAAGQPQQLNGGHPEAEDALEALGEAWLQIDPPGALDGRVEPLHPQAHRVPQEDRPPLAAPPLPAAPHGAAPIDAAPVVEPAVDAAPVADPAVEAPPAAIAQAAAAGEPQPAQVVEPQRPAVPAAAAPAAPAAPVAAARPAPATEPEPSILQRIWSVFVSAMEAFVDLVLTYVFCMPRATTAAPVAAPVVAPRPAPQAPAAQPEPEAPATHPIQVTPVVAGAVLPAGRVQGTLNLHPQDGDVFTDYCAREFLSTFWAQAGDALTAAQIQTLIDQSLRNGVAKLQAQIDQAVERDDFPGIENVQINRLGEEQNYTAQINTLHLNARNNPQHMIGAILVKGERHHVLFVDARDRDNMRYYHYNLHAAPAYLQACPTVEALANHLNEVVPVEADSPFRIEAYRVRAQ